MSLMGACKGWGGDTRLEHPTDERWDAPWILVRFQVLLLSAVGISVMLAADLPPNALLSDVL